jgi:hypothetical protein
MVRKVTNIFKNTNLHISYRVSNTTQKLLQNHNNKQDFTPTAEYTASNVTHATKNM